MATRADSSQPSCIRDLSQPEAAARFRQKHAKTHDGLLTSSSCDVVSGTKWEGKPFRETGAGPTGGAHVKRLLNSASSDTLAMKLFRSRTLAAKRVPLSSSLID